jgi:hypothetical protein
MIVKEAKEIVASSELSDTSLDKILVIFEGLKDEDELPEEKMNEVIAIMDRDANVEELISQPINDDDIPIDK